MFFKKKNFCALFEMAKDWKRELLSFKAPEGEKDSFFDIHADNLVMNMEQSKVDLWNGALDYLQKSRAAWWNEDYVEFLIERVWKITEPVSIIDFGCGIGFMGELMLPHLPKGSSYAGVDIGDKLLEQARKNLQGYPVDFIHADLCEFQPERKYDIAICQTVLQHIPNPAPILDKMKDSVKDGGLVISIDVSRNTAAAATYIDGYDADRVNLLGIEQKVRHNWYVRLQKDFEIGLKTPVYMQKAGLKNVDVRMNDFVQFVHPGKEDYERQYQAFAPGEPEDHEAEEEKKEKFIRHMVDDGGLTEKEAEQLFYGAQQSGAYIRENKDNLFAVNSMCLLISYGTV